MVIRVARIERRDHGVLLQVSELGVPGIFRGATPKPAKCISGQI